MSNQSVNYYRQPENTPTGSSTTPSSQSGASTGITPWKELTEGPKLPERQTEATVGFRQKVAKYLIQNEMALRHGDVGFGIKLIMVMGITAAFAIGGAAVGVLGMGVGALPGAGAGAIVGLYMGLRIVFFGGQEKIAYSLLGSGMSYDNATKKIVGFKIDALRPELEQKIATLQKEFVDYQRDLANLNEKASLEENDAATVAKFFSLSDNLNEMKSCLTRIKHNYGWDLDEIQNIFDALYEVVDSNTANILKNKEQTYWFSYSLNNANAIHKSAKNERINRTNWGDPGVGDVIFCCFLL